MNCSCTEHKIESIHLSEGKVYGGRQVFADDKHTMMDAMVRIVGNLKGNLDQKLIRDSKSSYKDLKDEFHDVLFGIFKSYQKGDITIDDLEKQWKTEIKGAWEKAYQLGVGSVGNPFGATRLWDEDKSWLKGAEGEEYGYLGRFVRDIRNNTLKMDAGKRLDMYAQTLDGVYHHGQVEGSPDYARIWWVLREAKHCDDCIRLAAGSPYTKKGGKNPLPGVPRDGLSRCLSKCQCVLRFDLTGEAPEKKMKGPKPFKVPEGLQLPTQKEYDHMAQMSTEIDRLRGLIDATTGSQRREYIAARRELNKDLHDYAKEKGAYYVPGSNYVQSAKPGVPSLPKTMKSDRPGPPKGFREPTDKEKEKIDTMAREVDSLRVLIATTAGTERKALIAKRYKANQALIDYMEGKKIYYLPYMELGIEMEDIAGTA